LSFQYNAVNGFLLTKTFHFDAEIAAGIILIGSCSSGLASNVMVYLAKANLVLSVIVTAMATVAAPLLTPLLMKTLAGTLININFTDMMVEIIKIVLVPIGAALFHDYLKHANPSQHKKASYLVIVAAVWLLVVVFAKDTITLKELQQSFVLSGFMAGAVILDILIICFIRAIKT